MQNQEVQIEIPQGAPPAPGAVVGARTGQVQISLDGHSPETIYHAARNHRREIRGQLEHLESRRSELVEEMKNAPAAAEAGIRNRLSDLDDRIAELDKALAAADAQVAAAAAVPGAVYEETPWTHGPPDEAYVLGGLFMLIVLLPLSIAFARRIWKRGTPVAAPVLPHGVEDRLSRLESGVDSIALEIERIGEGQRFLTKLMSGERAPSLTSTSQRD